MASKYAAAHVSTNGPGDGRPTAFDIIKDESLEGKLSGKVMLITGCSSGIGVETARALSATGAMLFLTTRDMKKGEAALKGILEPGRVYLLQLDLNSLASVKKCAEEFLQRSKTLNVLINNAGIMACPEGRTVDGFETQFGTNHLAHFLLFNLLKPTLLTSSTPAFNSRVIDVSSSGHRRGGIHLDDLNFEHTAYEPFMAYGQSKTANIYMTNEIERRYGKQGLHGLSLHPGGIMTGLQTYVPDEIKETWKSDAATKRMKSVPQGAATTVWAAVSSEWEGKGGKYLEDCQESRPVKGVWGYAPHAFDPEKEGKLWTASLKLVGLQDDWRGSQSYVL
ncbi:hypothetical protein MMC18_007354 [Xylographa bjoerkii]|nr:hypothetical protein [Xylographa bjoerkii]